MALARAAAVRGAATGYGAAARVDAPDGRGDGPGPGQRAAHPGLTAPMMGRLQARRAPGASSSSPASGIRLVHYAVLAAAFVFVVLGGLDEYMASYERVTGWLGVLPEGTAGALAVGRAGNVVAARVLQRRAGGGLPPRARRAGRTAARRPPRGVAGPSLTRREAPRRRAGGRSTRARWCSPPWWPARCCWRARRGSCSRAWRHGWRVRGRWRAATAPRCRSAPRWRACSLSPRSPAGCSAAPGSTSRFAARRARRCWSPSRPGCAPPPARPGCARSSAAACAGSVDSRGRARRRGPARGPRRRAAPRGRRPRGGGPPRRRRDLRPAPLADALSAWVAGEAAGFRAGRAGPKPALRARHRDRVLVAVALVPALALLPA